MISAKHCPPFKQYLSFIASGQATDLMTTSSLGTIIWSLDFSDKTKFCSTGNFEEMSKNLM
jgi:hypothetical protein